MTATQPTTLTGPIEAVISAVIMEGEVAPEHALARVGVIRKGNSSVDEILLNQNQLRILTLHYNSVLPHQLENSMVIALYQDGKLVRIEPPSKDWQ